MAIKSKDEILEQIQERFGEDTSDETISFLEDVTDTFTDLETRASGDGVDWKAKYEENDNEWRQKYRDRFFSPEVNDNEGDTVVDTNLDDNEPPKTFDDLFSVDG